MPEKEVQTVVQIKPDKPGSRGRPAAVPASGVVIDSGSETVKGKGRGAHFRKEQPEAQDTPPKKAQRTEEGSNPTKDGDEPLSPEVETTLFDEPATVPRRPGRPKTRPDIWKSDNGLNLAPLPISKPLLAPKMPWTTKCTSLLLALVFVCTFNQDVVGDVPWPTLGRFFGKRSDNTKRHFHKEWEKIQNNIPGVNRLQDFWFPSLKESLEEKKQRKKKNKMLRDGEEHWDEIELIEPKNAFEKRLLEVALEKNTRGWMKYPSWEDIAVQMKSEGYTCSRSKCYRAGRDLGLLTYRPRKTPILTEASKEKRVAFCESIKDLDYLDDLSEFHFTDESMFYCSLKPSLIYMRTRSRDPADRKVIRQAAHVDKVHVWGFISKKHRLIIDISEHTIAKNRGLKPQKHREYLNRIDKLAKLIANRETEEKNHKKDYDAKYKLWTEKAGCAAKGKTTENKRMISNFESAKKKMQRAQQDIKEFKEELRLKKKACDETYWPINKEWKTGVCGCDIKAAVQKHYLENGKFVNPFAEDDIYFIQDGARTHKELADFINDNECGVDMLPNWPPNSPDLNPIENVWGIMKQKWRRKIAADGPPARGDAFKIIKQLFMEVPQKHIDSCIDKWEDRVNRCIAEDGEYVG